MASGTADAGSTEKAEIIQTLRSAYPDPKLMPDDVKKLVDKYDVQTNKQLTAEMHRTTTQLGKARKTLHSLQDAKTKHRTAWLRHLKNLLETLQKQIESFDTQQKDYHDRIQAAYKDVMISRRTLQRLNAQASEAALPAASIGDDEDEVTSVDGEENELRDQVHKLLQQCTKASAKEAVSLLSDEEDMDEMPPTSKRLRSREPGDGPTS